MLASIIIHRNWYSMSDQVQNTESHLLIKKFIYLSFGLINNNLYHFLKILKKEEINFKVFLILENKIRNCTKNENFWYALYTFW